MAIGGVETVGGMGDVENAVKQGKPVVLHFWAAWCKPSQQMDEVFAQLSADTPQATFLRVEAEEHSDIAEKYGVTAVPFFIFINQDGEVVDSLEGVKPAELAHRVAKLAGPSSLIKPPEPSSMGISATPSVVETVAQTAPPNTTLTKQVNKNMLAAKQEALDQDLKARLEELINSKPVMLFMKGEPDAPCCGFSSKVVQALKQENIDFGSFDILKDDQVRQGLKVFSNWPTFPQLYYQGELVGGCDIVLELQRSGELKETLSCPA